MKFFSFILTIFLIFSCRQKSEKPNSVDFIITEKGDTLNKLYYPYYKSYDFMSEKSYDSVIFNKEAQKRMPGEYTFGIIEKKHFLNRYVFFKCDTTLKFEDFNKMKSFFLHEEYNLENYEVYVVGDYMDSLIKPVSRHQLLVALKPVSRDTLLFQEMCIVKEKNHLNYSLITYESDKEREEMQTLLGDVTKKIMKSAEDAKIKAVPNK